MVEILDCVSPLRGFLWVQFLLKFFVINWKFLFQSGKISKNIFRKCILNIMKCTALSITQLVPIFEHILQMAILIIISKWAIILDFVNIANEISDSSDNKSIM